jgi:hypothetical protein
LLSCEKVWKSVREGKASRPAPRQYIFLAVRSARGCEEETLDLLYDGGGKEGTEEFEAEFLGLDAVVE